MIFYLMLPLMQRCQASNRWLNYQLNYLGLWIPNPRAWCPPSFFPQFLPDPPQPPLGLSPPPTSIGFSISLSHFHFPQFSLGCIFKDSSHRFKELFYRTSYSGSSACRQLNLIHTKQSQSPFLLLFWNFYFS